MTKENMQALNAIIDQVPADRQAIARNLVAEIVFMADTLAKLKSDIENNGVVEKFEQGKQSFMRESPAVKSYTTMVNRYGSLFKQLCDMLPKTTERPPESELLAFINEE